MGEKKSWLKQFPVFAGTLVGIALTAIGGVMVLNTVLKLYVFGFDTPQYGNDFVHQCMYNDYVDLKVGEERIRLSVEEKNDCIEKKSGLAKKRYLRDKKENFVDGLAMLLVGIPFWIFFNRRRKED